LPHFLLVLGLVLLPLVYSTQVIDPVLLPRFVVAFLVMVLCFGLSLLPSVRFSTDWISKLRPLYLCLLGYGLITSLSFFFALNVAEVWMELGRTAFFISMFFLLVSLGRGQRSFVEWLLKGVVVSVGVIGVLGLWDLWQQQGQLRADKSLYGIRSVMAHKNLMASALFMGLPACFYFVFATKKLWRYVGLVVTFMGGLLIIVVQSRAVWLAIVGAFLVGLLGLGIGMAMGKQKVATRKIVGAFGGLLFLGISGWFLLQYTYFSKLNQSNTLKNRVAAMFQYKSVKNEHTETINERLYLWGNTWQLIKDQPLKGVGAGNWKVYFPSKGLEGLRAEQGLVHFQRPHNDFLGIWCEKGLFGLLLWLGIFVCVGYMGIRVLLTTKSEQEQLLVFVSLLGLLGYGIISFFDFPYERCLHLFYLAILLMVPTVVYLDNDTPPPAIAAKNRLLILGFLILNMGALWLMGYRVYSEFYLRDGLIARSKDEAEEALYLFETAKSPFYQLDPTAIPIDWYIGELFYKRKKWTYANSFFEKALKQHPYQVNVLNNLASTAYAADAPERAVEYYERALEIAPHFDESNLNMAALYFNKNEQEKALHYLLQCSPQTQNSRYSLFLSKIMPFAIQRVKAQETNPLVLEKLEELERDVEWQKRIHEDFYDKKTDSIGKVILDNCLFSL